MGVLKEISRLPDAIHRLSSTLQAVLVEWKETAPGAERLDELERSRALWEAEIEAGLLKADSKYKAAANAESRTRKQLEKLDPFLEEGDEVPEGIPPLNAYVGPQEEVPGLYPDVAPLNSKQLALRFKYL